MTNLNIYNPQKVRKIVEDLEAEISTLKEKLALALHPEFGWVYREQAELQAEILSLRSQLQKLTHEKQNS